MVNCCCHWLCKVTSLQNAADTLMIARHIAQEGLVQQVQMFLAYTHLDKTTCHRKLEHNNTGKLH